MSDMPGGDDPPRGPKKSLASRSASRARPKNAAAVGPAERIKVIMGMMAAGNWYGMLSHIELGELWGVAPGTVKNDANEAHRMLTADPVQVEQDRLALAAYCAAMRRQAQSERSNVTGLADITGGCRAAELEARFRGIDVDKPLAQAGVSAPRIEIRVIAESEHTDNEATDKPVG